MQLVEREMLYTGGKRENHSRRARNLKVKPQGDGAEKRPPIAVSGLQRGAGGGVRMCGKGRSALRPPNTGRFHALETRPHPVSKRPAEEQCAWARKTPWLVRGGVGREHCLHPARSKGL